MKTIVRALLATVLATAAMTGVQAADKYVIGVSNGWVGSEWRTQMIEETQAAAAAWKERGVEVEVLVQSKDVDVQTQISDVRNFINQGVNAILVNPNSPTAFNPVFAQAKKAGILVIATDGEVSSKDAYYVGINQKEWAMKSAKWLADALGGQGEVVTINGVAGHPANQARIAGYQEVFAQYPGIKVMNEASGDWDQAKSQQTLKVLLATYPEIKGVWVQDGMADGARRALIDAGRTDVLATGEIRASYLKSWKDEGWNSGASVNPPGCMASALNFAVLALQGGEIKDGVLQGEYSNAAYLPIPLITNENLDEALKQVEGKPDYTSVTDVVSPETLKETFFK